MSIFPRASLMLWSALVVIVIGILVDLHLTRKYGGADLRDKVIGSRSLLEGRSPYFEPWKPGDPERLADPIVPPGSELTRFTGSPFQALITVPLALVPYPILRISWLFLQYALLLFSVALMIRAYGGPDQRTGLLALGLLVVVIGSGSWRLHVERGQIYVIFSLMLAALFYAIRFGRPVLLGALGAALILIKPTFGLLLLPLVFKINVRMLLGGVALMVVALLPFLFLPAGFGSWVEYSEAMKIWGAHPGEGAIPPEEPAGFSYPATIEGANNLHDHHPMETENGSIGALLYAMGVEFPTMLPMLITLLLVAAVAAIAWKRLKEADAADLLLLGFSFNTILMMLLPTLRFHYQFVMWVAPILYICFTYRNAPMAWYVAAAMGGLFVIGAVEILPVNVLLAEILFLCLIAYYLYHRYASPRPDPVVDSAQKVTIPM